MNYYNIYFKGHKINNRPLTDNDLNEIKNKKEIYKRNNISNTLEKISVDKISIVKTIII